MFMYLSMFKHNNLLWFYRFFVDDDTNSRRYKSEQRHINKFWIWLIEEVLKEDMIFKDLEVLKLGPNQAARRLNGYVLSVHRSIPMYHIK